MLFILCMEPIHRLFRKATMAGLLTPLARSGWQQSFSMYPDDVTIFIKPAQQDLAASEAILRMFGQASGLHVNMAKSAALPIRCSEEDLTQVCGALGCAASAFPCKYLGLPLALRKPTPAQLQYLVDQMANCLPKWKAALMPKSGRLTLVQLVLCAMPIHAMMALDLPMKTIAAMNKVCRCFLWCK